jgi:hypothetical protein
MKTHCPKGHAYSEENTYRDPSGSRHCRVCGRQRTATWYESSERTRRSNARKTARESWTPPEIRQPSCEPSFGNWLAGFTDGEGCFMASFRNGVFSARFTIQLRLDDYPTLETIRVNLGTGTLSKKLPSKKAKVKANPTCVFSIRSIKDLYGVVVPIFDTYPLRSKKNRDYKIWRQIVIIAAGHHRGRGSLFKSLGKKLQPLMDELVRQRSFTTSDTP